MAKTRWPELCELVERDDGLPVRDCGPWTEDKLHFWHRYIEITTTAMVGHSGWRAGLVYVDLLAGPGVCRVESSGTRIPGSPLIAAYAAKRFTRIIVCEMDPVAAAACEARLASSPASESCHVVVGDCNEQITRIKAMIPPRVLTLAFVDPTGLHAGFQTLATLAHDGRVDFLVLFADGMDIVRNVELYRQQTESNLDFVLGAGSDWRRRWDALEQRTSGRVRDLFAGIFKEQFRRHLSYEAFSEYTICAAHGALYRLIYASKSERGLEFWHKATAKEAGGQKRWF
jgi:three-Cys-motif partner protein